MAALPTPARAKTNPGSATSDRAETQAQPRIDFIAVTQNDELLEQLGQALDGESAIRHADTVAAARDLIHASQGCVVMLDAREHADPARVLELLQSPSGLSVLVVFASSEQTNTLAQAIKRSATFAVLPVPIETAKTAAVLEGAREEALARRSVVPEPAQAPDHPHSPAARPAPHPTAPRPSARTPRPARAPEADEQLAVHDGADVPTRGGPPGVAIVGGIAVGALLLAVGAWFYLRGGEGTATPTATAPATEPAVAPSSDPSGTTESAQVAAPAPAASVAVVAPSPSQAIVTGAIDELLEKAQVAFRERRYTDPEKDNALVYYRSVLAQEPDNGEALEGLTRIGGVLDARLQAAITEKRYEEAASTLANLKLIDPADARLRATEARLAEARIAAALEVSDAERAAALLRQATQSGALPPERASQLRADVERRQADSRAQRLADLVSTRIREDRLLEPANDSAKFHLAQLRKAAGDSRRTVAAQREFENAVLQRAREAAVARQAVESERWLDEARAMGVSQARLAAVQREARAATTVKPVVTSDAERLATLVRERISDGRLLEPAQDSAVVHLAALRAADPGAAATASGALSVRLIERGRTSLAAGRLDDAERHVAAARQLGVNLQEVGALELNLAAARAPVQAQPVQVTAEQLKRTRYTAPEYPRQALAKELSGEVRIRYTIGTDGRVSDAQVISSNPSGVFDEVALSAVRRWRFKPHEVDGQPVEAVSGTVMVFKPDAGAKR